MRQSAVRMNYIEGKGCYAVENELSTLLMPAAVKVMVTQFS